MKIEEVNLEELDLRYEKLRAKQPGAERKLMAWLGEAGQQSPVIVVRSRENGAYVVIDGHKRVRALKKLKADVVKAAIWEMREEEALAVNYRESRTGGGTVIEEGWLVAELHKVWRWNLARIGEKLVKSVSWVSRRLTLAEEMPEYLRKAVSEGRIGAHAAMYSLTALTRVNWEESKFLVERICEAALTSREIKEICQSYGKANVLVRSRIVRDPVVFLRAQSAARQGAQDPELSEGENRCAKNLMLIGNVCSGLARSLPQVCSGDGSEPSRKKLALLWDECMERFKTLAKTAAAVFREEVGRSSQAIEKRKEAAGHVG